MDRRSALRVIDSTLRHIGFVPTGPGPCDYDGTILVHGKPVSVAISIPDVQFVQKPRIHLKDRSQIPVETLAHIEEQTGICYSSGAGLPLDIYNPGQAILRVLEEAKNTLELSYGGRGQAELIDEYQHYWRSTLPARCFIARSSLSVKSNAYTFIACEGSTPKFLALAAASTLRGYEAKATRPAKIWRLDGRLGPAGSMFAPSTLADLKIWFHSQPELKHELWDEAFQILLDGQMLFLAGINALLGIDMNIPKPITHAVGRKAIRKRAMSRVISSMDKKVTVERYAGKWSSMTDVAARNNPRDRSFSDISVAVIGCGTIGSHLARMIAQCGAGSSSRFTLFDPDILTEGNIGRHLLGLDSIGQNKAHATAENVKRFHPGLDVFSYEANALDYAGLLGGHELVIDATGEWNVQCALNDWFLQDKQSKTRAVLHSWVFMNGASVQSFLNLKDQFACFRCLKPSFNGQWRYPAGDEREPLNLRPATCGDGSFVPFTVDTSVMAASLATRAGLDWINNNPGPRLRTIVVDYQRGREQKPRTPAPSPTCPACSTIRPFQ